MRIMGLDYGTKTVGVAISDELLITAQPVVTITRNQENKLRQTYAQIEELITKYDVTKIILGYPKNMNNSIGERGLKTEEFREDLIRRTTLEVELVDERLTTIEADRILDASNVSKGNRKEYIDKMAAAIILQNYLDKSSFKGFE